MQQRIETIADDTQNTHGFCASACSSGRLALLTRRNAPFIFGPPCQSELKRTLRHGGCPANTVHWRGFNPFHGAHSTRMVNDRFPGRSIYGFESVDAPITAIFSCSRASIEYLRRIESFEISANFRRV